MAQEASDRYTDTHTHVIEKELAEGQLSKKLGKHEIIILSPNGKGSPRQVHRHTHKTEPHPVSVYLSEAPPVI